MKKEERESQKNALAGYLRYLHLGWEFALAVGLLTWGGIWLDGRLGTWVLFTLLGLGLGFGVGLRLLYSELYGDKGARRGKRCGADSEGAESNGDGAEPSAERRDPGSETTRS